MARSRLLKPEFHTSPQVAKCSHSARLAFIGTFNFCDDNGVHVASISRLRMEVFAHDECSDAEVREWVLELLHVGLISVKKMSPEVRAAIASIEVEEIDVDGKVIGRVKKVKLWDKNSAADKLLRHLGAYEKDNRQRLGVLADLPRETLRLIVERLRGLPGAP